MVGVERAEARGLERVEAVKEAAVMVQG